MLNRRRVILSRNDKLLPKRVSFSESMLSFRITSMIEEEQEEGERREACWLAGWLAGWLAADVGLVGTCGGRRSFVKTVAVDDPRKHQKTYTQ